MTNDRTTLLVRLRKVTNARSDASGNPVKKLHTAEHGDLLTEPGASVGYAVENFLPRYAAERAHGRPVTLTLAANGRVVGIDSPRIGLPEPVAASPDSLALRAVLDLHRAVEVEPSDTICAGCSTLRGAGESLRYFPVTEWPCATVRAITAHIDTTPKEK